MPAFIEGGVIHFSEGTNAEEVKQDLCVNCRFRSFCTGPQTVGDDVEARNIGDPYNDDFIASQANCVDDTSTVA